MIVDPFLPDKYQPIVITTDEPTSPIGILHTSIPDFFDMLRHFNNFDAIQMTLLISMPQVVHSDASYGSVWPIPMHCH